MPFYPFWVVVNKLDHKNLVLFFIWNEPLNSISYVHEYSHDHIWSWTWHFCKRYHYVCVTTMYENIFAIIYLFENDTIYHYNSRLNKYCRLQSICFYGALLAPKKLYKQIRKKGKENRLNIMPSNKFHRVIVVKWLLW